VRKYVDTYVRTYNKRTYALCALYVRTALRPRCVRDVRVACGRAYVRECVLVYVHMAIGAHKCARNCGSVSQPLTVKTYTKEYSE
jgi:hypothetical protein